MTVDFIFTPEQVSITGDLTRQTVPLIKKNQTAELLSGQLTTIDFSQIGKVDTAGLAWLFWLLEQSYKNNMQLRFVNMYEDLLKMAKLSGVDDFLPKG